MNIRAEVVDNKEYDGEVCKDYPFACKIYSNGEHDDVIFKTKEEAEEVARRINCQSALEKCSSCKKFISFYSASTECKEERMCFDFEHYEERT